MTTATMMETRLYAISLWQPWASLLFAERDGKPIKAHETRHWVPAETGVVKRGARLLIHAAKTKQGYREMTERLHGICVDAFGIDYPKRLPLGCAIGTVVLTDWYPADPDRAASDEDMACGGWGPGRYAWRFDKPMRYGTPMPMAGRQGFWRIGQ